MPEGVEQRASDRAVSNATADPGLWLGILLLCAYAVPLWLAPDSQAFEAPAGGLLARLFPGVPGAWVLGRLLALAAGSLLVVRAIGPWAEPARPAASAEPPSVPGDAPRGLALGLAVALAIASAFASSFGAASQVLFVVLLFLPAGLLARAEQHAVPRAAVGRGVPWPAALVVAAWIPLRLAASCHSPRSANPVDMWLGFEWLAQAAREGRNFLSDGFLPGQTLFNQALQGVFLLEPLDLALRFSGLQIVHILWAAGVGLAIAHLAAVRIGRAAAPVAAASFLFSPFALTIPLNPSVLFVGPVFGVGILLLLERSVARRSGAALLALAALCGLAATNPALVPLCGVAGLIAAWRVVGSGAGRGRLLLAVSAVLVFVAALGPALPRLAELPDMLRDFTEGRGQWAGLEAVLFGQRTPFDVPALWQAGRPGPLDIPLGALLAPFAIARQPIRLWGDALLDPLGAALAAVGVAVLLRRARHGSSARVGLILLAATLVPAFVSSYDRPSLSRLFAAPVLLALLAGLGFEALRSRLASGRGVAAGLLVTVAVAVGGTALYDAVNPRILRASWLGIAIEALEGSGQPRARAGLLTYGGDWDLGWLHVDRIAAQVPREPLSVLRFEGPASLAAATGEGVDLLLWSPALDADARVTQAVCSRWPRARLYTLWDRPRLARALAARPDGTRWLPALPGTRWEERPCARAGAR